MKLHLILISMLTLVPLHASQAQLNNNPDHIQTNNGVLSVYPILHGSIVFEWNTVDIYIDPYGGTDRFNNQEIPDLILISHPHDDHFHLDTLKGLNTSQATFIVPEVVAAMMPAEYLDQIVILKNGESTELNGISILAVPMYNLPEEGARHAKGWGNGYILTLGGKRIYVSGDTEGIPEMRKLNNIDVAFVCMNLPYTMDINQAASAVLEFEPDMVYPYHHRGQDIEQFKALVNASNNEIEVRLKDWYTE